MNPDPQSSKLPDLTAEEERRLQLVIGLAHLHLADRALVGHALERERDLPWIGRLGRGPVTDGLRAQPLFGTRPVTGYCGSV